MKCEHCEKEFELAPETICNDCFETMQKENYDERIKMNEENRQMKLALVRINEIVEENRKLISTDIYNMIKLYSDVEQRQEL